MMELEAAKESLDRALARKDLIMLIGDCRVQYHGRAASNLPTGSRLLLIKGDGSFAIHQNKLLRPTNYLMANSWSTRMEDGKLVIAATKRAPKESLTVTLEKIEMLNLHTMEDKKSDFKLVGSERELSNQLMDDLEVLEKGLKPLKQESHLRKGMIDILAEDKDGNLVVIELKRRQADYDSVMQLHRYVHEVKKTKGRTTRGILVAPEIRKTAMELLKNNGLEYRSYQFDVSQPKATIAGIEKKQKTIFESLNESETPRKTEKKK